eukprot:1381259-Amorphochlora_amoeboformis.AAC.2
MRQFGQIALARGVAKSAASCGNMDDGVIGDPSLTVTTNVVMDKSKKMGFMKAASKLVSSALGIFWRHMTVLHVCTCI